ncbi:MAG TPA: hypothetical protein VGC20_14475, partial [bacterium]
GAPWLGPRPAAGLLPVLFAALLLAGALAGCQGGDEFSPECTAAVPCGLTYPVAARESQVGPSSSSYYSVSPVVELSSYTVSITELVADADLFVYSDSGFTGILCVSAQDGTASESCTATTISLETTLYIKVKSNSENGTDFLMTVN